MRRIYTQEEAERMGAFEETGIDYEDVLKAEITLPWKLQETPEGESTKPPGENQ